MNFKTTLFLLALVVLVGTYFIAFERKQTTTSERQQAEAEAGNQAGTPLYTADQLSTSAVQSITIERDGVKAELQREGEEWAQSRPVRFAMNHWSVQQVVDAAAALRYSQKLTAGEKGAPTLEKLGLAKPEAVVTLGASDKGKSHEIKVGRMSLGRGYVQIDNDAAVYVVNDALHKLVLEQQVANWRKKNLTVPIEGQANAVTLTRDGKTIQLTKADGNWSLGPPYSGRADSKAVGVLMANLGG
jgi:hypothetical protein